MTKLPDRYPLCTNLHFSPKNKTLGFIFCHNTLKDQSYLPLWRSRCEFNPWVKKIPWKRKWQPTLVLLLGKFHWQRSLVDYSPCGRKESDMTEWLIQVLPHKFSSVQFSHSVVSKSLQQHGLQHARLPCPSPTPRVYSNSRPSSPWCHPTISSSVVPFSYLQSFPASGSFPMSQFFASGGQSIGVSASASALSMNIQDWFPLRLTGLISLQEINSSAFSI